MRADRGLRQLLGWSEARTTPAQRAGAQIWRYEPRAGTRARVYTSPRVTGQDGTQVPRDRTVRVGTVFQGTGAQAPVLYFGGGSMEGQAIVLRSRDGQGFEQAGPPGLGLGAAEVPSLRTLSQLEGRLFTSPPVGKNHDRGLLDDIRSDVPVVLESRDPARWGWRPVSEPGFGDPGNLSVDEMASFDGALYAGTHNPGRGYQIWKTDARRRPPSRWRKILEDGAFRGPPSSVPPSMLAYDGALYVGSGLEEQGRPLGPIRISWTTARGDGPASPARRPHPRS